MVKAQSRGRPRNADIDDRLLSATRDLLAQGGYSGLTMDDVAARARVGKAAIYRRYATKAELAFAASIHRLQLEPLPDTGSLRGDLREQVHRAYRRIGNPLAVEIAPAVINDLGRDGELLERFRATFLAGERDVLSTAIDRARSRGELAQSPDVTIVHLMLVGPLFTAAYGYRIALDVSALDSVADTVTSGILARQGSAGSR